MGAGIARWYQSLDKGRELLLPALIVVPLCLLLVLGGPQYMLGFTIITLACLLFVANTRAFILTFMVLIAMRNWVAGGSRISIGILDFDLGGLANVLTTLVGGAYFLVLWRNPFKGRSLTLPYLLFWGLFAISMPRAPDFRQGIRFVTRLAAPFVTYLIISDLLDAKMVRNLVRAIYASSVIPMAYGFYELVTGQGNLVTRGFVRVQSCFNHPAHFSMYLLFLFCLAYATFIDRRTRMRPLWLAYIVAILVLLVSTYTRISWVAAAVCFLYLSWVYGRRRYVLVALAIGALAIPLGAVKVLTRVEEVQAVLESGKLLDRSNSIGWRFYFWDHLIEAWKQRPWTGFGSGSSIVFGRELMGVWTSPHNGYLRVLYETGIIGLLSFAWVLLAMMRQAVRLLFQDQDDELKLISHIYVTMTISYIILNLTDNILEYYEVAIYNWAILSLVEYTNRAAAARGYISRAPFEENVPMDPEEGIPHIADLGGAPA